ncbi:hypothetical protein ACHAXS_004285 [Conticribra weissflogii]
MSYIPDDSSLSIDSTSSYEEKDAIVGLSSNGIEISSTRKLHGSTIEMLSPVKHLASSHRARRITDSILEDNFVAGKLKLRLGTRREQSNHKTPTYPNFSDFVTASVWSNCLNAVSAAMPTDSSLSKAVEIISRSSLAGYFSLDSKEVNETMKQMLKNCMQRFEFRQGDIIFKQNGNVEKLIVIEEGSVECSSEGQWAGDVGPGYILGEVSLIYGVSAPAEYRCKTPFLIAWSLDALSFRRIRATLATESLNANKDGNSDNDTCKALRKLKKRLSACSYMQEQGESVASKIPLERLHRIALIGKGGFGSVYVVKDNGSSSNQGPYFCLKRMSKTVIMKKDGKHKRALIEKNALIETGSCPFTLSLFGTYQDSDSIYFLTDFAQGGDLMGYMVKQDILTHDECIFFSANIVAGLEHIHKAGFAHRDLKPENILIGRDGFLKICDFGMAKRLPSIVHLPSGETEVVTVAFTQCGSPGFMAPEVVWGTGYTKSIDYWALGCIIVEMYTAVSPFDFDDLQMIFKKVGLIGCGREKYTPPVEMNRPGLEEARDFVQRLLCVSSERLGRTSSTEVKEHEYFSSIDFGRLAEKKMKSPYEPNLTHAEDFSHFEIDPQEDEIELYRGDNCPFRCFC